MKIDSKECREALEKYQVKNEIEKLAVRVLTTKDEDVWKIPGIIEMNDDELDELTDTIKYIRDNIGIEK